jgi:hypothetical protein
MSFVFFGIVMDIFNDVVLFPNYISHFRIKCFFVFFNVEVSSLFNKVPSFPRGSGQWHSTVVWFGRPVRIQMWIHPPSHQVITLKQANKGKITILIAGDRCVVRALGYPFTPAPTQVSRAREPVSRWGVYHAGTRFRRVPRPLWH